MDAHVPHSKTERESERERERERERQADRQTDRERGTYLIRSDAI